MDLLIDLIRSLLGRVKSLFLIENVIKILICISVSCSSVFANPIQVEAEFIPLDKVEEEQEDIDLSREVRQLLIGYEQLSEIFNEFGGLVQVQDDNIHLVFKCCQSSFEASISSLLRIEAIKMEKTRRPWLGLSTGVLGALTGVAIGVSGAPIPAIIVAGSGAVVAALQVALNEYKKAQCQRNTNRIASVGGYAVEVLEPLHLSESMPKNNSFAPHAGSAASRLLHQQSIALQRIEKIMDLMLALLEESEVRFQPSKEESVPGFAEYLPRSRGLRSNSQMLQQLSADLEIDKSIAVDCRGTLENQDQQVERLLEKSARLNGKVLEQTYRLMVQF